VFGLTAGEWGIVAFLLFTVFGAQSSGRLGERVAQLFSSPKQD
jgi:hypothetical protein